MAENKNTTPREPLIFEISDEGKRGFRLPDLDVPEKEGLLDGYIIRADIDGF